MSRIAAVIVCLISPSCSWNVYSSGKHQGVLSHGTHRSAVISELGAPALTQMITPENQPVEGQKSPPKVHRDTYFTRQVLPDWFNATGAPMACLATLGVSELYMLPRSLGHFSHKLKRLDIEYDKQDRLWQYCLLQPTEEEKRIHSPKNRRMKGG